jgi:Penicillin amidase
VTITRDRGFGVLHVYGKTRSGTMFGAGYAGAEDRLFLMDVLRHAGRAELSEFLGGGRAISRWTASSGRSRRTGRPTSSASTTAATTSTAHWAGSCSATSSTT